MAQVPGRTPDPQPDAPPHHDHYLPDKDWETVVQHAKQVRVADPDWPEDD